jgi:hypothetical protein
VPPRVDDHAGGVGVDALTRRAESSPAQTVQSAPCRVLGKRGEHDDRNLGPAQWGGTCADLTDRLTTRAFRVI